MDFILSQVKKSLRLSGRRVGEYSVCLQDDGDGWSKVAKMREREREYVKLSECGKPTPLGKTASVVPLLANDSRLV